MSTHDVRPRVVAAVSGLNTFTVAQLCEAAGLQKRDQAYSQIDRLRREGFLEQQQLPAGGRRHRPLTLYRLTTNWERREEFAKEVLRYRPLRLGGDDSVGSAVLQKANTSLDAIVLELTEIQQSKDLDSATGQLRGLNEELEAARTNIETALIEYGSRISAESTPRHPAILARNRWSEANNTRRQLERDLAFRRTAEAAKKVAITAAGVIAKAAIGQFPAQLGHLIYERLKENRWKADPAIVGRLLDDIADASSLDTVISGFFWNACLVTQDSKVILKILKKLSGIKSPWLEFNEENAHLLTNAKVDWERWLRGYERFGQEIHLGQQTGILGVYSCPAKDFTQDAYVRLTQQHRMSVIARQAIDFLGASQPVHPALLFALQSHWQKFDCSYLNREQTLHAYGPLAQDIQEIPGAPPARVAACLGYWGITLEPDSLMRITQPLVKDQTLIVVQNRLLKNSQELSRQLIEVLPEATEVAVKIP